MSTDADSKLSAQIVAVAIERRRRKGIKIDDREQAEIAREVDLLLAYEKAMGR